MIYLMVLSRRDSTSGPRPQTAHHPHRGEGISHLDGAAKPVGPHPLRHPHLSPPFPILRNYVMSFILRKLFKYHIGHIEVWMEILK